jgi:hypothetical protein
VRKTEIMPNKKKVAVTNIHRFGHQILSHITQMYVHMTFIFFFSGVITLCRSWPSPRLSICSGGVVAVEFFGVELLAPHLTPNLDDQGLHFALLLPIDLSGKEGPTRSLQSRQHSSPGHSGAQTSSPR